MFKALTITAYMHEYRYVEVTVSSRTGAIRGSRLGNTDALRRQIYGW